MHGVIQGLSGTIHPDDHMFTFMRDMMKLPHDEAVEIYELHGRETAELFCDLIREYGDILGPKNLLEFASGYGCVTRVLLEYCPDLDITCCDIHPAAVEFLRAEFGVDTILSSSVPEQLAIEKTFDVVFVVSLFSHLPKSTWTRWLRAISRCVAEGGLLIFSTHGYESRKNFVSPVIDEDGFWFHAVSEQLDIDMNEYGSTITSPTFVTNQIDQIPDLRLQAFQPAGLRKNQDVYVVKRTPGWRSIQPSHQCVPSVQTGIQNPAPPTGTVPSVRDVASVTKALAPAPATEGEGSALTE